MLLAHAPTHTNTVQYTLAAGNCKNTITLLQYMKRFGLEKNWQNLPMCQAILVKPGFACTAVVKALTRAGVGPA